MGNPTPLNPPFLGRLSPTFRLLFSPSPHPGRILFCNVHDSYNGDVVTYSDDGGASYRFSGELHKPGLDECALAQLRNGSVLAISRSCNVSGGFSSANNRSASFTRAIFGFLLTSFNSSFARSEVFR